MSTQASAVFPLEAHSLALLPFLAVGQTAAANCDISVEKCAEKKRKNSVVNGHAEKSPSAGWTGTAQFDRKTWDADLVHATNKYYFSAAKKSEQHQWIDASAQADGIDTFARQTYFGAIFGGKGDAKGHIVKPDTGMVKVECYDETKKTALNSFSIGPLTAGDHLEKSHTELFSWIQYPKGTRHLKVTMTHDGGSGDLSALDNISLYMTDTDSFGGEWGYVNLVQNPSCEHCGPTCWWNEVTGSKMLSRDYCWQVKKQLGDFEGCGNHALSNQRLFLGKGKASDSPFKQAQFVEVGHDADKIDEGARELYCSALLGGFGDREDYAEALFEQVDEDGNVKKSVQLGPVKKADRNGESKFVHKEKKMALAKGTRRVKITLTSTRGANAPSDDMATGFLDDITAIVVSNAELEGCDFETVLWMAIDVTKETSDKNMKIMLNGIASALEKAVLPHMGKLALGINVFAGTSVEIINARLVETERSLLRFTKKLRKFAKASNNFWLRAGNRDIGNALAHLTHDMKTEASEFEECKRSVGLVVTTGHSNIGQSPFWTTRFGESIGYHYNCLGVTSEADCTFATETGGTTARADDFEDVEDTLRDRFEDLISYPGKEERAARTPGTPKDKSADKPCSEGGLGAGWTVAYVAGLLACCAIGACVALALKASADSSTKAVEPLLVTPDVADQGEFYGDVPSQEHDGQI